MIQRRDFSRRASALTVVFALSAAGFSFAAEDALTKSTGTGTMQGENGNMSTERRGNTGPTTGRNADSGSATGKVRDPKESEPETGKSEGSSQRKSTSSHAEKHSKYDDKKTKQGR